MSNRSKDELRRMLRANFGRTSSPGLSVLPTGKGQIQKAFKQETGLLGSVLQKEKFCMWIKESKEMLDYVSKIRMYNLFRLTFFCDLPTPSTPNHVITIIRSL